MGQDQAIVEAKKIGGNFAQFVQVLR